MLEICEDVAKDEQWFTMKKEKASCCEENLYKNRSSVHKN